MANTAQPDLANSPAGGDERPREERRLLAIRPAVEQDDHRKGTGALWLAEVGGNRHAAGAMELGDYAQRAIGQRLPLAIGTVCELGQRYRPGIVGLCEAPCRPVARADRGKRSLLAASGFSFNRCRKSDVLTRGSADDGRAATAHAIERCAEHTKARRRNPNGGLHPRLAVYPIRPGQVYVQATMSLKAICRMWHELLTDRARLASGPVSEYDR